MSRFGRRGKTTTNIRNFLALTEKYTSQNTEPGDYYKAVWCRDAAYIIKDQFLSGHHAAVFEQLRQIWRKQIGNGSTKLIYGRGSPKTNFTPTNAEDEMTRDFCGALPTTIFDNFCEVYAFNPDIDSTALMIYVTAWVLTNTINDYLSREKQISAATNDLIEYLIPFLFRGIEFLASRDKDKDGLLEQDHNEDWMDTVLRNGKVVYSQACWLMALTNFADLLFVLEKEEEARRLGYKASRLINSIENRMWFEERKCYVDIGSDTSSAESANILYQDIVFYIFAMSDLLPNLVHDISASKQPRSHKRIQTNEKDRYVIERNKALKIKKRMILALGSLRNNTWFDSMPLVTEKPLLKTGPWILQSNEYHNYTHWPWITAVELLTRFRFGQAEECNILLSNIFNHHGIKNESRSNHDNIFYEWLNPATRTGGGAYPFRTGISAYRLASFEIVSRAQLSVSSKA
jgi:hypothetical protein